MTPDGKWNLSPAYDVTYAHNPAGKWTNQHQMSVNNKRDKFTRQDLITIADSISLNKAEEIINDVVSAVDKWPEFAKSADIKPEVAAEIKINHR